MPRELNPAEVIKRLNENESLLDILIEMEDFLDSLDLYAFKNWIDGEVVEGPVVSRYWCEMTLKYPYSKMPDPKGGMRLVEHDVRVSFKESTELNPIKVETPNDFRDGTRKPKLEHTKIWLVSMRIPRRFIDEIIDQSIEMYDDEVEIEDVESAEDEGLDMGLNNADTDAQGGADNPDSQPAQGDDQLDLNL
jgi:hypothetical protein